MVTLEEARRAGLCGDCDVRYAAIRVAVASPKTTTLPTAGERALVEEVSARSVARLMSPALFVVVKRVERATPQALPFDVYLTFRTTTHNQVLSLSLKAPLSGQRHGLARAFRPLFARYHEALRIHSGGDGADQSRGSSRSKRSKPGPEGPSAAAAAGGELEAAEQAVATVARILCEVRRFLLIQFVNPPQKSRPPHTYPNPPHTEPVPRHQRLA
jgi:hypothetical protein